MKLNIVYRNFLKVFLTNKKLAIVFGFVRFCYILALMLTCFCPTNACIFDPKQLLRVSCILWCYYSKCYSIIQFLLIGFINCSHFLCPEINKVLQLRRYIFLLYFLSCSKYFFLSSFSLEEFLNFKQLQ